MADRAVRPLTVQPCAVSPGAEGVAPDQHHLFPAETDAVRRTLAAVTGWLHRLPEPPAEPATVELVLAELLNNVVEHACATLPGRVIGLELWSGRGGLACRITDDGRPMPGGRLPRQWMPPPETLPEGGFGWPLVTALARDLAYRRDGGQNVLSLRICPGSGT
ncbi:MAG: ATP-binding protein [Alphaproteobacteria bacterium HGW-Alphaproteobacteria-2]|nr:MAG: ATP-binding protein [Alphaproteobacteria bacterium HGW-Alphaproteobacteria-2]